MAEKTLKLYKARANFTKKDRFPTPDDGYLPLEIGDFTFDAKRMGGAPTIQCTIMYHRCLDDEWSDLVFTEFRGERYYLRQTPSSSKDNKDARWKHEAEFVAERVVLDNIYFFDVVAQDEIEGGSAPVSNSTEFTFFGTIDEFVGRLNASLLFSEFSDKYEVKINAEYQEKNEKEKFTTGKLVAFTDKFFSQALQEIYNVYELYYYFKRENDGKTIIYIADYENIITDELEYGALKSLISVKKDNANYKPINRICGRGSEDNIPYYYPNPSSKGTVVPIISGDNNPNLKVSIKDGKEEAFYTKINDWNTITISQETSELEYGEDSGTIKITPSDTVPSTYEEYEDFSKGNYKKWKRKFRYSLNYKDGSIDVNLTLVQKFTLPAGVYAIVPAVDSYYKIKAEGRRQGVYGESSEEQEITTYPDSVKLLKDGVEISFPYVKLSSKANFEVIEYFHFRFDQKRYNDYTYFLEAELKKGLISISKKSEVDKYIITINTEKRFLVDDYYKELDKYLLELGGDRPNLPLTISQKMIDYKAPQKKLQAKVYIDSINSNVNRTQRFYPAKNGYPFEYIEGETEINEAIGEEIEDVVEYDDETGDEIIVGQRVINKYYQDENNKYYEFENPYLGNNPYEHIIDFPDIKPSIEGMENDEGLRIDMFSEFAYDDDDNNFEKEYSESGNDGGNSGTLKREHPYFFGKLRKLPFNLFDHAIENGEMTVAMTNGKLGSCKFVIHVGEETQKNLVQVWTYEDWNDFWLCNEEDIGTLKRDEHGNVLCGRQIYVGEGKWEYQTDDGSSINPQDQQNDTRENEVWVALAKDTETFPSVMPYAEDGTFKAYRPKADKGNENVGDTFVLLNIHLPQAYIDAAEEKLTKETLKYMAEFNKERFNFAIDFSRIFLAENPTILEQLNENAKIKVVYNGEPYEMYISGYSYKMSAKSALPEIKVDLADTLTTSQGVLQNVISEVKASLLKK